MDKRTRNLAAIGLLMLVAGGLFVWGLYFLMGNPIWRGTTDVVLMLEDAAGLKRNDRVQVNGVQVGAVREVRLESPSRVRVDLRLDEGIQLPADTRARLKADVFGTTTVELVPGSDATMLAEGDTIRGLAVRALPDLVATLGGQAESILTSADRLLAPEVVADLRTFAAAMPAGAQEMLTLLREMRAAAESLRRTAKQVEDAEAGAALAASLEELQRSAKAFTSAANAMEQSFTRLASIMTKIDSGDGTLARLVNDPGLYAELEGALREVRLLATDVRENPKRYVTIDVF
jgi:phospholipid/cholesterol/gamma-HCH transport system substrate-binding protein